MSNRGSSLPYRRLVISRSNEADRPFRHVFYHGGKAGVHFIRVLRGTEEFVDRPHEQIDLPNKAKMRFHYMFEGGQHFDGKQIRISRGGTVKSTTELLHDISIKLRDILKLDMNAQNTFIEPLQMYRDDIYIICFDQVSVGTTQVVLAHRDSKLRHPRSASIPDQPPDGTSGHHVMPVNRPPIPDSPIVTNPGVSFVDAHHGHSGSHTVQHDATSGYPVGRGTLWPSVISPQVHHAFLETPAASSSGLPAHVPRAFPQPSVASFSGFSTDNAGLYTGGPSYSLPQPIGREDGIPGPSVDCPHSGGVQGSPECIIQYSNADIDIPNLDSWPSNDQDANSTDGA